MSNPFFRYSPSVLNQISIRTVRWPHIAVNPMLLVERVHDFGTVSRDIIVDLDEVFANSFNLRNDCTKDLNDVKIAPYGPISKHCECRSGVDRDFTSYRDRACDKRSRVVDVRFIHPFFLSSLYSFVAAVAVKLYFRLIRVYTFFTVDESNFRASSVP